MAKNNRVSLHSVGSATSLAGPTFLPLRLRAREIEPKIDDMTESERAYLVAMSRLYSRAWTELKQ
jgi:hypothetical protein